jgi:hypothetical protein
MSINQTQHTCRRHRHVGSPRRLHGFDTIRRYTWSYYRMRGAIAVPAKRDDLEIMAGSADSLTLHQFAR